MKFKFEPKLISYIKKHGHKTIVIEMVEINNSDFEINELHVHFVNQRMRSQFIDKKRYRSHMTEHCEILLPPFPLKAEDTVTLGLKSMLLFHTITCSGIEDKYS